MLISFDRISKASRSARAAFPLTLGFAIALGGCAHNWAPGPTVSPYAEAPIRQYCSEVGAESATPRGIHSHKVGAIVVEAAVNAIAEGIETTSAYNACMSSSGFVIADNAPPAAFVVGSAAPMFDADGALPPFAARGLSQTNLIAIADTYQVGEYMKSCTREIRRRPAFASLLEYLPDLDTGRFSMAQMTVTRTATVEEGAAFAAYVDATKQCSQSAAAVSAKFSQRLADLIGTTQMDDERRALAVTRREQGWGDYALGQNEASGATRSRPRTSSL